MTKSGWKLSGAFSRSVVCRCRHLDSVLCKGLQTSLKCSPDLLMFTQRVCCCFSIFLNSQKKSSGIVMFSDQKSVPNIKLPRSVFVGTEAPPLPVCSFLLFSIFRGRGDSFLCVLGLLKSVTMKTDIWSLSSVNNKQI